MKSHEASMRATVKPGYMKGEDMWLWLKIKELGLRRFWSLVPFTKGPILAHLFEPQPCPKQKRLRISALLILLHGW